MIAFFVCGRKMIKQIMQINMVKNPKWQEADQLAIYKHDKGVKLGTTEKRLDQLSGQSRTWTHNLQISSPML